MTIQHEITESDHRHSLRVWPAAVVAFGLVLCSHIIAGLYIKYPPFGSQSANLDDQFRQIIPFLDQFGTILRGTSTSDMLFNWNIGLGANFLPDYATHLAGPWDFLAGIVPMTMTDGLVWIIATLNYSCAAAAMVYLLNAIRPISSQFSRWLIAAVSAGYGLCSWSLSTAYLFLPWTYGLVAFPMITLAGIWSIRRIRMGWSVAIIALFWCCNYYTAYMASIAAAVVIITYLVAEKIPWRQALAGLGRFTVRGALGVAGSMPLLLPTYLALKDSAKYAPTVFFQSSFVPITKRFFGWLLPITDNASSTPAISSLLIPLLAVIAIPFVSSIPVRARIAWCVGCIFMLTSIVFVPTLFLWHVFTIPNGSLFRETFVVSGFFVVAAWIGIDGVLKRFTLWPLWVAQAAVVVIYLASRPRATYFSVRVPINTWATKYAILAWLVVLTVVTILAHRKTLPTRIIASVVILGTLAEGSLSVAVIHSKMMAKYAYPQWSLSANTVPLFASIAEQFQGRQWPHHRTLFQFPLLMTGASLLNSPGIAYWSSVADLDMANAMKDLGLQYLVNGRIILHAPDEALMSLLGASGYVTADHLNDNDTTMIYQAIPAMPVARLLQSRPEASATAQTIFDHRNQLVTRPIYSEPASMTVTTRMEQTSPVMEVTTTCSVGTRPVLRRQDMPYEAVVTGVNPGVESSGGTSPSSKLNTVDDFKLSSAGIPAVFTIKMAAGTVDSLPPVQVACLNQTILDDEIAAAQEPQQLSLQGSTIKARFAQPVTGELIISTATTKGWTCTVDGERTTPRRTGGLFSLPMEDSQSVECHYRPAGLISGMGIGAGALVVTLAAMMMGYRRRRHTQASQPIDISE